MITHGELTSAEMLIDLAIAEDLDDAGDVTSLATIPADLTGQGAIVVRTPGIIAGLPVGALVARRFAGLVFTPLVIDGIAATRGDRIATVAGPMRALLSAERTILNFMQRLSGIATLTRRFVDVVAGRTQVLDTRKTHPGWRLLDKYAVRMGGGHNHRIGLFDGILIKDNHLAGLGGGPQAIERAIDAARRQFPNLPCEVEVDSFEQFQSAIRRGPEIILLDNMNVEQLSRCVRHRNDVGSTARLEASGGVNLDTINAIADTGVDRISVGELTHSAKALDLALDYEAGP